MILFEYDERKNLANREKHGIDFLEAQKLWEDPFLIEVPAIKLNEPRFLVIGRIGIRHWSEIVTPRDEKIRLISVRRSRKEEVALYESQEI